MGRTLAEKVWDAHVVRKAEGEPDLLYIDLHLVHEVTSPQAFDGLRMAGRSVRQRFGRGVACRCHAGRAGSTVKRGSTHGSPSTSGPEITRYHDGRPPRHCTPRQRHQRPRA